MALSLFVLGLASFFLLGTHQVTASTSTIKSGVSGYCLDSYRDDFTVDNKIDIWTCNNTAAQDWTVRNNTIQRNESWCLTAPSRNPGNAVVLDHCTGGADQLWLRDQSGYMNPNSNLCLAVPQGGNGISVMLASCHGITTQNESWSTIKSSDSMTACSGTEGQKVACFAEKEWTTWQSGIPSHQALLNAYTDGTPYEAWCADFVSYVYKEAGYPFTGGEADGWDENNANNIQNMGFTVHDATDYTPQPGDVAYFDYDGGHVEIVVSGGPTPTFIYGNSATIDPTTGNGQMEANTITSDGIMGHVIYYFSPSNR